MAHISPELKFVLASRSPRRLELLQMLVPLAAIEVVPPRDPHERGFEGLHELGAIEQRLSLIAREKAQDTWEQLTSRGGHKSQNLVVIAADTIIVANDVRTDRLQVLGQPPDDETWPDVVRHWFLDYYACDPHLALTGLCVQTETHWTIERIVQTHVQMSEDAARWLDWYIGTGEPRGKAGGYAIQGAGSVFVRFVDGSISNVIGLPLEALLEIFKELPEHVSRPH
ncbi:MAG: hypothetical protein EXS05_13510 [Planctomycetaceae bacterium]|nr:hypothetical protein [Planctomycetaceae bacterium]